MNAEIFYSYMYIFDVNKSKYTDLEASTLLIKRKWQLKNVLQREKLTITRKISFVSKN